MALPAYSSRDVNASWGPIQLSGFAKDSFITITPNSDITDEEIGADGQLQVSLLPDRSCIVSAALMQNSPANVALSALYNDQIKGSGWFKQFPFVINDPAGSVLALLNGAYIKTRPTITLSSSATGNTHVWSWFVEEMIAVSTPPGISSAVRQNNLDTAASAVGAARDIFKSVKGILG